MNADEIEALAEAIVRKSREADEKKAAKAAEEAAKQAEADRVAAEKAAKVAAKQAEIDRIAAEKAEAVAAENKARHDAVMSAKVGEIFVDSTGAEHRVIGVTHDGVDTVSRDKDGGVVGNWRLGRAENTVLHGWSKKA